MRAIAIKAVSTQIPPTVQHPMGPMRKSAWRSGLLMLAEAF